MVMAANLPSSRNGSGTGATPLPPPATTAPLFGAEAIKMQRMMRVNPLPMLNPQALGTWMDQFDAGQLRMLSQLWDQMARRDDTLVTVKPQLENAIASQDWGVHMVQDADPIQAARHKAALDYFYDHMRAVDAFDRNERGGRDKFIEQMMTADSFRYAVHHFVWKPQPGKMIPVEGADPVPALTAEMEYVPLWFFENTTGRLRFLPDGGFGVDGRELNWDGEWMVTAGRGLMFAAAICYTFKRLSFQDWMIFMERYAQGKVVVQTSAQKGSEAGNAARSIAENFNEEIGFIFYESQQPGDKPPISILGPEGTVSVDIWRQFIDRQDAKMSAMYRGNDLSMMSRAGDRGEKRIGASLQQAEGDAMEKGACRRVAGVCQEFIDRKVIEFCFGVGVEPLAYFGLPDMDVENTEDLRASAEFLVKHGARVSLSDISERLGIQLVPTSEGEEDLLVAPAAPPALDPNREPDPSARTPNAADLAADLDRFLGPLRDQFAKALSNDLIPLRLAIEHVVATPNAALQRDNVLALQAQLPWILKQITANTQAPKPLTEIIRRAFAAGVERNEPAKRSRFSFKRDASGALNEVVKEDLIDA